MDNYSLIELKIESGIALLAFNRPDKRNAMSDDMRSEFIHALERVAADKAIRALVLTGNGKGFCAGGDVAGMQRRMEAPQGEVGFNGWSRQQRVHHTVKLLHTMPKPTIAAVNGAAYAGGMEIALACDFIYAAQSARFALTEVSLGIMPGASGTQNLPRAVGVRRAKEIVLTADPFTAEQAYEWGMVNKVCADATLMGEVLTVAHRIASNAPVSVRQAKKSLDRSGDLDRNTGYAFEIEAYNRTIGTEDRQEGINAFNEKRKPQYKGR